MTTSLPPGQPPTRGPSLPVSWMTQYARAHPIIATFGSCLFTSTFCYPIEVVTRNFQKSETFKISKESLWKLYESPSVRKLGLRTQYKVVFLKEAFRWAAYRFIADKIDSKYSENVVLTASFLAIAMLEAMFRTPVDIVRARAMTITKSDKFWDVLISSNERMGPTEQARLGMVANGISSGATWLVWAVSVPIVKEVYQNLRKKKELHSRDFLSIGAVIGVVQATFVHGLNTFKYMQQTRQLTSGKLIEGGKEFKDKYGVGLKALRRLYRGFPLALASSMVYGAVSAWLLFNVHSPKVRKGKEKSPEPSITSREGSDDTWNISGIPEWNMRFDIYRNSLLISRKEADQ